MAQSLTEDPAFRQAVADEVAAELRRIAVDNAQKAQAAEAAAQAELDAENERLQQAQQAAATEAEKWENHTHTWGDPDDSGCRECTVCHTVLPHDVIAAGEEKSA